MNEAETRAEHIDPALKAAGWGVVEGSRVLREHGITLGRLQGGGKRAKAEIADYNAAQQGVSGTAATMVLLVALAIANLLQCF